MTFLDSLLTIWYLCIEEDVQLGTVVHNLTHWEKIEIHAWNIVYIEKFEISPSRSYLNIAFGDSCILFTTEDYWIWANRMLSEPIFPICEVTRCSPINIPCRRVCMICRSFGHEGREGWLLLPWMLCNLSLLLRPSLVGFFIWQPLSRVLLHITKFTTIMTCDSLQILGSIITFSLPFRLSGLAFAFVLGWKGFVHIY